MEHILFDKFGIKYEFNNGAFIKEVGNDNKSLLSFLGSTEDEEIIRLANISAIISKKNGNNDNKRKSQISFHNVKETIEIIDDNIKVSILEKEKLSVESDIYKIMYVYKYINYIKIENEHKNEENIYKKGYLFFKDGSFLEINNIVEKIIDSKDNGFITGRIFTNKNSYAFSNCISILFYTPTDTKSVLNLTLNSQHIQLKEIKKSDLSFSFDDNSFIDYKINNSNSKSNFNFIYYQKYLSSLWFSSNKRKDIVNIDFKKQPYNKNIISI